MSLQPSAPVRVARGTRRPQDGLGGMRSPESQEEKTHPRASCGKEPRQHRQSSTGRWPGGGHEVDTIISSASSKVTLKDQDGRKTIQTIQTIRESEVVLAVVAEPYRVSDAHNWVGVLDGSTAITSTSALSAPGVLLDRGSGYVAAE